MSIRLKDLIDQLKALRQVHGDDIPVDTEGCDCVGPCTGAEYVPENKVHNDPPMIPIRRHND